MGRVFEELLPSRWHVVSRIYVYVYASAMTSTDPQRDKLVHFNSIRQRSGLCYSI